VHMVVLNGKMNDAKRTAAPRGGLCDGRPNHGKNELTAQRPKPRAQRNVHGMAPTMQRSRRMRHLPSPGSWLSSRPTPPAAPRRWKKHLELL
jgi:hypothetical protein